jgi:FMN phosphatase YigB (HAD superfamily)
MKYSAVIFDLWGTLVPSLSNQEYMLVLERMASSLSVPLDDFNRIWFATARERNIGTIQSIDANIERICKELGIRASDAEIRRATRIRLDFVPQAMRPRADAIESLSILKTQGFKIS